MATIATSATAQVPPALNRTGITGTTDTALRNVQPRPVSRLENRRPAATSEGLDKEEATDEADAKVTFQVTKILFTGNTIFTKVQLALLARPYEHRSVTLKELRQLCLKIRDVYRKNGYILARAGVPPQKVKRGRVKIAISEGRYGKVTVKGNEHYDDEFIERFFSVAREDPVVRKERVERALLLLNSFSDLQVKSIFDIGKQPGTTDVVLEVKDATPVHYGFDFNNYGNALVGRNRAGLGFWGGNAFLFGDEFYLHATESFPGDSPIWYQGAYTFPLGYRGDRLSISYLNARTAVGGDFAILDITGQAQIGAMTVTHPLERTARESSNLSASLLIKEVENFIFGNQLVSRDKLREVTVGYDRNWLTDHGRLIFSGLLTRGMGGALGGTVNGDQTSSRPGAQAGNEFTKLNLDAAHMSQFGEGTFVFLRLDSQLSTKPLVTPEQYALGGADSVRGFQQSEFLGDQAVTASAELRQTLFNRDLFNLQGVAFIDGGYAEIKNPLVNERVNRSIAGAGVGLRATFSNKVSSRIDLGFPISGKLPGNDASVLYGQIVSKF